MSRAVLTDYI